MLSNLPALKIVSTLTMCINSKALYGLKQAPRAWYECLRDFLITNGFKVGKANPTLFTKTLENDLFVCLLGLCFVAEGLIGRSGLRLKLFV